MPSQDGNDDSPWSNRGSPPDIAKLIEQWRARVKQSLPSGGSRGLIARDLAEWIMAQDPSMMNDPESRMGLCALRPCSEILAGTEAYSGELAN